MMKPSRTAGKAASRAGAPALGRAGGAGGPRGGPTSRAAGQERRELLLEEATRLFGEQGYHATTMRQIAEATGLLPGSLYTHIRSKEQLLYDIVREAARAFMGGLEAARAASAAPEERFRAALRAHIEVVTEHQDAARVFHHEWHALTGRRRAEIRRLRDRYERGWDEILRGIPGIADPRLARLLVLSVANWVYTWYRPRGPMTPDRIAARYADLLLGGLRADPPVESAKIPRRGKETSR